MRVIGLRPARNSSVFFFFQAEDGIRDLIVTGVQTCALPISPATALEVATLRAPGDIVELYSTSDVFTPARGRTWMKFSFDFPEPAIVFGDHRFSFLVFTDENTYGLDRSRMRATGTSDALEVTCDEFVWAGGQQRAPGKLRAAFSRRDATVEWHITVEMDRPIKS